MRARFAFLIATGRVPNLLVVVALALPALSPAWAGPRVGVHPPLPVPDPPVVAPQPVPEAPEPTVSLASSRVWVEVTAPASGVQMADVSVSPEAPNRWLAVDAAGAVYLTDDGGGRWMLVLKGVEAQTTNDETVLLQAEQNSGDAFDGGTVDATSTSDNDQAVHDANETAAADAASAAALQDLNPSVWFDTAGGGVALVGRSGETWRSADGGETWRLVDPENGATAFARVGAVVVAGGDDGVRASLDAGSTWLDVDSALAGRRVNELDFFGQQRSRVEVTDQALVILDRVLFELGSAVLRPESNAILSDVALTMIQHPELTSVEVEGHTDDQGTDEVNQVLSERRANAVRDYLIAAGVDDDRLVTRGYGSTVPLQPGTTDDAREANRRVEFRILSRDPSLALPAREAGVLYAATDNGLFRSTDALRWTRVGAAPEGSLVSAVDDPDVPGGYWVAAERGLFRTNDDGGTFLQTANQPLQQLVRMVHLAEPGHLLAISGAGVWESTDSGVTWEPASRLLTDRDVRALDFTAGDPLIATANGIWRMIKADRISDDQEDLKKVMPLGETIQISLARDGLNGDQLSLARRTRILPFLPTATLQFQDAYTASRSADFLAFASSGSKADTWQATVQLCWGGCSTSSSYYDYSSDNYDVQQMVDDGTLNVIDGEVYDDNAVVAAAASVSKKLSEFRFATAQQISDAWLSRQRLAAQTPSLKDAPLRQRVMQKLAIQELDARLDAWTEGQFSTWKPESK